MFVFKLIKPSTLKKDVFRLEFLTMLHKAERRVKKDFKSTTETWDHDVVFESMISLKKGPQLLVWTDDEIYSIVSRDVAPYNIPKTGTALMTFQVGYVPKTVPGAIGSQTGGKYGSYTRRKKVRHPGHEGRHFDTMITELWRPRFKRMAEEAMKIAVAKSGHKI